MAWEFVLEEDHVIELGILIITAIGGGIWWLLRALLQEIRQLRIHVGKLEVHLFRLDTRMSYCKYCPQPRGEAESELKSMAEESEQVSSTLSNLVAAGGS